MPTIPELRAQLKELKKKHKEIRITGLNKSEMMLLVSKYTNIVPEKVIKKVDSKILSKEEIRERMRKHKEAKAKEKAKERETKVANLSHNLDVLLKVNKIRKFANVVKEKLDKPKRVKKLLEEVEAEVSAQRTRQNKLITLQKVLAQMISGKRINKFFTKVKEDVISKRDYSHLSFV
jgi:signal transduction histidine kinase